MPSPTPEQVREIETDYAGRLVSGMVVSWIVVFFLGYGCGEAIRNSDCPAPPPIEVRCIMASSLPP